MKFLLVTVAGKKLAYQGEFDSYADANCAAKRINPKLLQGSYVRRNDRLGLHAVVVAGGSTLVPFHKPADVERLLKRNGQ